MGGWSFPVVGPQIWNCCCTTSHRPLRSSCSTTSWKPPFHQVLPGMVHGACHLSVNWFNCVAFYFPFCCPVDRRRLLWLINWLIDVPLLAGRRTSLSTDDDAFGFCFSGLTCFVPNLWTFLFLMRLFTLRSKFKIHWRQILFERFTFRAWLFTCEPLSCQI